MQAFNPFLPSWEYIPDGEPYVFGDRVYVYGSHDRFNAPLFCMNDYVCWSAPLSDLGNWSCSGVIYRRNQDPMNRFGLRLLFAPDVAKGPDGRYYLYYAYDFLGVIGVAVCDTPDGQYTFYGHVHDADGKLLGRRRGDDFPFDPGVLVDDDGRVYLYSGFATRVPMILTRFHRLGNSGGSVMELEQDMLTIRREPKLLFPRRGSTLPGGFEGHEFFEASSIRKVDGRYVFVYSSCNNHELCWAQSDRPDGGFLQAEVTSCGLNGGPLEGRGSYPARIACNLWSRDGVCRYDQPFPKKRHPYITQRGRDDDRSAVQYIANMRDGSVAGFKYFRLQGARSISVKVAGRCAGVMQVSSREDFATMAAELPIRANGNECVAKTRLLLRDGVHALYFRYQGSGAADLISFELA